METDVWHQWVLLRPLFAFLLACPFLILPLLISWLRERPDAKRQREYELASLQRDEKDVGNRGYEASWSRKWPNRTNRAPNRKYTATNTRHHCIGGSDSRPALRLVPPGANLLASFFNQK